MLLALISTTAPNACHNFDTLPVKSSTVNNVNKSSTNCCFMFLFKHSKNKIQGIKNMMGTLVSYGLRK